MYVRASLPIACTKLDDSFQFVCYCQDKICIQEKKTKTGFILLVRA